MSAATPSLPNRWTQEQYSYRFYTQSGDFCIEVYTPAWSEDNPTDPYCNRWQYDYWTCDNWTDNLLVPDEISEQGLEAILRYAEVMWRMQI